jgi:hypothetical protein
MTANGWEDAETPPCKCGHFKVDHIYAQGACRPGFVCLGECKEYRPSPAAGETQRIYVCGICWQAAPEIYGPFGDHTHFGMSKNTSWMAADLYTKPLAPAEPTKCVYVLKGLNPPRICGEAETDHGGDDHPFTAPAKAPQEKGEADKLIEELCSCDYTDGYEKGKRAGRRKALEEAKRQWLTYGGNYAMRDWLDAEIERLK